MKTKCMLCFLSFFLVSTAFTPARIRLQFQTVDQIDSIKIENLDSNGSHTFYQQNELFIFFDTPTDVIAPLVDKVPLNVYTTPDKKQVFIDYYQQQSGQVNCEVFDIQGKRILALHRFMENGLHKLTLSTGGEGFYIIRITTAQTAYKAKFVSLSTATQPSLNYIGTGEEKDKPMFTPEVTSAADRLTIRRGNLLRISCYSGTKKQILYDYANSDKIYQLSFSGPYHQFLSTFFSASKPALIDAAFTVTDALNKGVDDLRNSNFVVKEDNAIITAEESFRHVAQQSQGALRTVLLIDNSVSIVNDLQAVKNAATQFVRKIRPGQQMAIYVFSESPVLMQDFSNDTTQLKQAVANITLGYPSTNMYGALISSLSRWSDIVKANSFIQGSLILFTDGNDTQGANTLEQVLAAKGSKKVYVVGMGNTVSPSVLSQIASPSGFLTIPDVTGLENALLQIQADIVRHSRSFYSLNYMSPKRAGIHTFSVSTIGNKNTSGNAGVTGNFDATGFRSVNSGVYANVSDDRPYGIDSVFCVYKDNAFRFSYSRSGAFVSADSLILTPSCFWAFKQPNYSWSISDDRNFSLVSNGLSLKVLKARVEENAVTVITLQDQANGYTKQIGVRMIVVNNALSALQLIPTEMEAGVPVVRLGYINGITAPIRKVLFTQVGLRYRFTPVTANVSNKNWSYTSSIFTMPSFSNFNDGTGQFGLKVNNWTEPSVGQQHQIALQAHDKDNSNIAPVVSDYANIIPMQFSAFISNVQRSSTMTNSYVRFRTSIPAITDLVDFNLVAGTPVDLNSLVWATASGSGMIEKRFEQYGFEDYRFEYSLPSFVGYDGFTNQNAFVELSNSILSAKSGSSSLDRTPLVLVKLFSLSGDLISQCYIKFKIVANPTVPPPTAPAVVSYTVTAPSAYNYSSLFEDGIAGVSAGDYKALMLTCDHVNFDIYNPLGLSHNQFQAKYGAAVPSVSVKVNEVPVAGATLAQYPLFRSTLMPDFDTYALKYHITPNSKFGTTSVTYTFNTGVSGDSRLEITFVYTVIPPTLDKSILSQYQYPGSTTPPDKTTASAGMKYFGGYSMEAYLGEAFGYGSSQLKSAFGTGTGKIDGALHEFIVTDNYKKSTIPSFIMNPTQVEYANLSALLGTTFGTGQQMSMNPLNKLDVPSRAYPINFRTIYPNGEYDNFNYTMVFINPLTIEVAPDADFMLKDFKTGARDQIDLSKNYVVKMLGDVIANKGVLTAKAAEYGLTTLEFTYTVLNNYPVYEYAFNFASPVASWQNPGTRLTSTQNIADVKVVLSTNVGVVGRTDNLVVEPDF